MWRICLLWLGCSLAIEAAAIPSDTLVMNNGQVLIGTFKTWERGKICFDVTDAGKLFINDDQVRSFTGKQKKFRVETASRQVAYGMISAKDSGYIAVTDSATVVLRMADVVDALPYKTSLLQPYDAYIAAGYNYSRSNQVGTINLDAGIQYITTRYTINGTATSALTHNSSGLFRNRDNLVLHIFKMVNNPRWLFGARILYQRNRQQQLEARYLAGAGMIYNALFANNRQLYLFSGLVLAHEKGTDATTQTRMEIPLLANLQLYRFREPEMSLTTSQTVYLGGSGFNRIRHDGELRLSWNITDQFSLTTYVYDNYDSRPLAFLGKNLDFGWMFGIKFEL